MEVIRVQEFKGGARETRFVFSPILKLLALARILMSARSSCCQPILGDRGKVNLSQSIYFGRTRTDLISLFHLRLLVMICRYKILLRKTGVTI